MSHNCEKARALAYRYLDREMVWYRRLQVRWHLRRCPRCEHGFHFEEVLRRRIHEGCHEEIPTAVYERLRAALRELPIKADPPG
ncbi:MAG: zf-HC2 domain-containing protein [Acidimicrobiia bacterium]|nr:zf-HC2 domain-containing protein [Acidimicrobiia bacterium]